MGALTLPWGFPWFIIVFPPNLQSLKILHSLCLSYSRQLWGLNMKIPQCMDQKRTRFSLFVGSKQRKALVYTLNFSSFRRPCTNATHMVQRIRIQRIRIACNRSHRSWGPIVTSYLQRRFYGVENSSGGQLEATEATFFVPPQPPMSQFPPPENSTKHAGTRTEFVGI